MPRNYTLDDNLGPRFVDQTGLRFGRLLVVQCLGKTEAGRYYWLCKCDCGNDAEIQSTCLVRGTTKSCGCIRNEKTRDRTQTHGLRSSREYNVWNSMISRCHNTKVKSYTKYGGCGIKVCDRWRNSFACFYEDMGKRPSEKHTIERIDNSLGYEPTNCKWATRTEQGRNTRRNVFWTFRDQTKTISAWAEFLGCRPSMLWMRKSYGWSVERILSTPVSNKEVNEQLH